MSSTVAWGASPEEWAHFSKKLDLEADLLPVVSNPNASISPRSDMKGLGKTPSLLNRERLVVGIPKWTLHQATDKDVGRWSRDSDLGICIQTRDVRAIDIDIGEVAHSDEVRGVIELLWGSLPLRKRGNSGKCLLAFRMPGQFVKRVIRAQHGIIEFLANGQQFIAVGTHPSGARYEWEHNDKPGLPAFIPEITPAEFEQLWQALQNAYGIEPEIVGRSTVRPVLPRSADAINDSVVSFLETTGWVRSWQSDGRVNINCPWRDEHSSDSGDTETQYFPAGVGGFEQGHFHCLHAHCASRTDGDFLNALGVTAAEFSVVEAVEGEPEPLPPFKRSKSGKALATLPNVLMALRRSDVCGKRIGLDTFRDELMLADDGTDGWRAFTDADYTMLREHFETIGFMPVGRELMRDAVRYVAVQQTFDSAKLWLTAVVPAWDGVPRVRKFFARYFGAKDDKYAESVSQYVWSAMAGRVLQPGVKADMVPILVGGQGVGKTTGVKRMAPSEDHFAEISLDIHDDNLARKMRGKLVGELGELRGLNSKDGDAIKQWISRTHEEWVPKFMEFSTKFPRRLVFIGTTNQTEFLVDETGERRWLPLRVGKVDTAAIEADRDQLWAEGAALFVEDGVQWSGAQDLAVNEHGKFKVVDPWEEPVQNWLGTSVFDDGQKRGDVPFTSHEVLVGALSMGVAHIKKGDEMRVGRVLRALGFDRTERRAEGVKRKVWVQEITN